MSPSGIPPTMVDKGHLSVTIPAFLGLLVAKDGKPTSGFHPLVVISHGYGGSWRNQSWLAGDLASPRLCRGGARSSWHGPAFDKTPAEAARLWERPRDLDRVIDALTGDSDLGGGIAKSRIAAVGHSLGGWTVIALAGARFEAERVAADCKTHSDLASCVVFNKLGTGQDTPPPGRRPAATLGTTGSARLSRSTSVLREALRPQVLRLSASPSLFSLRGPTSPICRPPLESGYLMGSLPAETSRYVEVAGATHFSFMQLCKPGAVELIEEETPGDGIVCQEV